MNRPAPTADQPPGPAPTPVAEGPAIQRPIEEFISMQGTFCIDDGSGGCAQFNSPTPNVLTWFDPATGIAASVDYAGLAGRWMAERGMPIGTTVGGDLLEHPQGNGLSLYSVELRAENAASFAVRGPDLRGPAVFGYRPWEIKREAGTPALGSARLRVQFYGRTGDRLPDLIELVQAPNHPERELVHLEVEFFGNGAMREGGMQGEMRVHYSGSPGPLMPGNASIGPMAHGAIQLTSTAVS
jgi:hypothetical protein